MAPLSTLLAVVALTVSAAAPGPSDRPEAPRSAARGSPARGSPAAADVHAGYVPPAALRHYLRARVALGRGDEREAAQEMNLAIAFEPSSAALRAAAADLFLSIGDMGRASGEARRAVDLGRTSDVDALVTAHAVLGRIAASEARWQAAAAELEAAARIADALSASATPRGGAASGESGAPARALPAEDRFVLGVALEALRRWDDAALAFARVGSADDTLAPLAALRQAYSLSRGTRHEEALEVIARTRRAGDVRFATMQAFVLGRAGRSDEAATALRAEVAKLVEADAVGGAVGELFEALGSVLVEAGRPDEAVTELERGLVLLPGDRKLVVALAIALERRGDVDGAAERVAELLAVDPDDVEALNFVGYMFAERGIRLADAERLLVRAAELAPREGAVLDSLGWLWFRKGETARAIRTLERADALAGPDPTILEHLGDAYRAGRRDADAARSWRRALEQLDADPPRAAGEAARVRLQRDGIARKLESLAPARTVR